MNTVLFTVQPIVTLQDVNEARNGLLVYRHSQQLVLQIRHVSLTLQQKDPTSAAGRRATREHPASLPVAEGNDDQKQIITQI